MASSQGYHTFGSSQPSFGSSVTFSSTSDRVEDECGAMDVSDTSTCGLDDEEEGEEEDFQDEEADEVFPLRPGLTWKSFFGG